MDVVVVGAHGRVGQQLVTDLVARGATVRAWVRADDQLRELAADGVTPALLDVETADVGQQAEAMAGADAVVWAAGAGGKGGADRTYAVDHAAQVRAVDAAQKAGVARVVVLSALMARLAPDPAWTDEERAGYHAGWEAIPTYGKAKTLADADLVGRGDLDWVLVRADTLTDDAAAGTVDLRPTTRLAGVARADVASVLAAVALDNGLRQKVLDLSAGETKVDEAVAAAH